jgi:hypothetical protein
MSTPSDETLSNIQLAAIFPRTVPASRGVHSFTKLLAQLYANWASEAENATDAAKINAFNILVDLKPYH